MIENCSFEVTPYSQANEIKSVPNVSLNYTNQDFWSLKTRLVDFINQRFGEKGTELPFTFNDFVEGNIAIMLLENIAFIGDTLSFKIDQIVNEMFIDTVTEVENAFRLSQLVGFEPLPPIASRSLWRATINNTLNTDLVMPTPILVDAVSNNKSITIELFAADSNNRPLFDQDIIIPAGKSLNNSIIGLEGKTYVQEFTGNGAIGQNYQIGNIQVEDTAVIWDSISVDVDGVNWSKVEYFTDSQPRQEYRVAFDSNYQAYIIFGNNRAGMIPSTGSRIRIRYRVGGGTIGNIVTGFISVQKQFFVSGLSFSVPVFLTNYTKGEYGYNGDTIDDIRRKLPNWIKTQNRAVSGNDYKTLADQFATPYNGQIGKSTAVLRNYGCAANIIDIYILAKDGENGLANASNELKVQLLENLNDKKMLTDFVCIKDGVVFPVDVTIDISLDKSYRKFELELRENITRKVNSFFSLNNWDYGKDLKDSDLIREFSDLKQIDNIVINFITNDENNSGSLVTTQFYEIIRPDEISIVFLYT